MTFTYQPGQAVKLQATFEDSTGAAFNPASIDSIEILAPDLSVIDATLDPDDAVNSETGSYYIIYNLPTGYSYIYHRWTITDGDGNTDLRLHKVNIKI